MVSPKWPDRNPLHVQYELEGSFPRAGRIAACPGRRSRADATYDDMNAAVAQLEQAAMGIPSVTVVPTRAAGPAPDRPMWFLCDSTSTTPAPWTPPASFAERSVKGDEPGLTDNGRVRLYAIGQGALSAAAQTSTKHDIAAAERWNLPIVLIVLVAVFGSLAAAAIPWALGCARLS